MRTTTIDGGRDAAIDALAAEGLDVTEWHDDPGASYEEHRHPFAEVRVVLEGSITFIVDGREVHVGPGDRIDLAPHEPHAATVGGGGVHYLAGTRR